MRVQTQWRVSMSGPVGLDYGSVLALINLYGMSNAADLLEDLQVIESAILVSMSKRQSS